MPTVIVSYRALRDGGACRKGILEKIKELKAAGVAVPRAYSTFSIDLRDVVRLLGVETALDACMWLKLNAPWLRHFAADCAEKALLDARTAGREPDARSFAAIPAARDFADGKIGASVLAAAESAAWSTAESAARKWQAERLLFYLEAT